jgi:predicted acylesterase/phospholipase RssA
MLSRPLIEYVDMVSGTSTGGIIAAGIAIPDENGQPKFTIDNLVEFYETDARRIFTDSPCILKLLLRSKYSNSDLRTVLREKIGEVAFGKMLTNVIIPTYSITDRRPFFFKSWKGSATEIPTDNIVAATCSAPIFFDPTPVHFTNDNETRYLIDGAVVADNPAMCAFVEAQRLWGDEDVFVISLGCGDTSDPISGDKKKRWGAASWIPEIVEIVTDADVNTIDYQLRTINTDLYVRMQCRIEYASKTIDDATPKNIQRLRMDAEKLCEARKEDLERIARILEDKLDMSKKV